MYDEWNHVSLQHQERICKIAIVITTFLGAALAVCFVTTGRGF